LLFGGEIVGLLLHDSIPMDQVVEHESHLFFIQFWQESSKVSNFSKCGNENVQVLNMLCSFGHMIVCL
jgi:hypothetical protein